MKQYEVLNVLYLNQINEVQILNYMDNQNQKSWIARNWPWALPVGCCSGCLIFIILIIVGFGATVLSVVNSLGGMSPIEEAIELVKKDARVTSVIGEDIKTDGFPQGNISISDSDGEVDFVIPIKGELGEAELVVKGIRKDKKWIYEDLYVEIKETSERINLLEKEKVLESI
ncbi:Cytochrome oxidase complex assembly protein 1 [Tenacibaculum sp. 190524A05c]